MILTVVIKYCCRYVYLYDSFNNWMVLSSANHNERKKEVYERLSAFNVYKSYGFDIASTLYPQHVTFVSDNKDKTLEAVRTAAYKELQRSVANK